MYDFDIDKSIQTKYNGYEAHIYQQCQGSCMETWLY